MQIVLYTKTDTKIGINQKSSVVLSLQSYNSQYNMVKYCPKFWTKFQREVPYFKNIQISL